MNIPDKRNFIIHKNKKYYFHPQYYPPLQQPIPIPIPLKNEEIKKNLEDLQNDVKITPKISSQYSNKLDNIYDLLQIASLCATHQFTNVNLDQDALIKLREPLLHLCNLVGMDNIKSNIFNQLIYFLQNIETQHPHMLHTCIQGPPGCGKTELANILAQIYSSLKIIKEPKVVIAKRSELIAGYLGQTAKKTQQIIDSAKGGVLLIDEAYSLGNEEKRDSFAKECIDTLNQNLTEGKADFVCIIAGYKEELEKSFFSFNAGLERRFPYRFTIDDYNGVDLYKIFQTILKKSGWDVELNEDFFVENRDKFVYNGGDMENLAHFAKIAYAKNRIFGKIVNDKILKLEDLQMALNMFIQNKNKVDIPQQSSSTHLNMYC